MPTIYTDVTTLKSDLQAHPDKLPEGLIDNLAYTAQLGHKAVHEEACKAIMQAAIKHGVYPASIHELYMAFARGEVSGFTVPALNVRALTYDFSAMIHSVILQHSIGPVIFEIALSEQEYTDQTHMQYTSSILAGAMKAGYAGPVFLMGDHYQLKTDAFRKDKEAELKRLQEAMRKAFAAGFYNIDIDGSTLVNLDLPYKTDQQKDNFEVTGHLAKFIRQHQPDGVTVSIGGEIGHIGDTNSTPEDLHAFMDGLNKILPSDISGLSKIAIQTGTSHGGTPEPDGSVAPVTLAADLHKSIGTRARKYGIGGTVQHGASTLPVDMFHLLPDNAALEVHLATGWQNCLFENMSQERRNTMYEWIRLNLQDENKRDWTDEQFVYKARKKSLGHFKLSLWMMDAHEKAAILDACANLFTNICKELRVVDTRDILLTYIHD